jgi:hypothetical protein
MMDRFIIHDPGRMVVKSGVLGHHVMKALEEVTLEQGKFDLAFLSVREAELFEVIIQKIIDYYNG